MTDTELESQFSKLLKSERKITNEILIKLNLIEDRMIHLKRGCTSVFEYLVRHHGYSEPAAHRRVMAARALRAVPEISEKIQDGSLNLTTLSKTSSMIRAQEKATGTKFSNQQKAEVITNIENKTIAEAETILFKLLPEAATAKKESIKQIAPTLHRLSIDVPNELLTNLKRISEVLSHSKPGASTAELLVEVTSFFLRKKDPLERLSKTLRAKILKRDNGECQWEDPITGAKCKSKFRIEIDHIVPRAHGGKNTIDNLRCLCREHNKLHAIETLGAKKANEWRRTTFAYPPRN